MKTKFLLTLCTAALLALTPAMAATEAAPVKNTVEATQASKDAPATTEAAPAPATGEDNAMTKTDGNLDATVDDNAKDAAEGEAESEAAAVTAVEATANAEAEPAHDAGAHSAPKVPDMDWSFNGAFGTFDRPALQRGFQVYKNVCAACHSLNRLSYRNLSALGYNEAEIKSIAAEATITDGPNDEGEMFERPGRPSDRFKAPFINEQAARAANGGALPPDLSLIVRARANGANYVHGILTGYKATPAGFALNPGMNYNEYFAGHQIAMPAPLSEGAITYDDGTAATVDQMAKDVTTFLAWASEPVMEQRKQMGIKVVLFLLVFSGLMYLTKRKVWKDMH